MGVIVFNAVWIGVDTEWNHGNLKDENGAYPLEPVSIVIENLFCVYFTGELIVRFLAFSRKKDCMFDAWFVFDSVLVACMILETWIMVIVEAIMGSGGEVGPFAALRLLRLLRLARVGRLMKFLPELGKLVKGMVKAARSVVFILIFLVLVVYVFAIIFTGTLSDREAYPKTPYCDIEIRTGQNESEGCLAEGEFGDLAQDLFATMGDSFMSLFTRGVLGDNLDETVAAILDQSVILMWLFFIFLIITFATLLNMLIGVVCEVIGEAAAEEEEAETVNMLTYTIQDAFEEIDENEDGLVTAEEWSHIKENTKVRKSMAMIGIEDERMDQRLSQMQEMLFHGADGNENEPEPPAGSLPSGAVPTMSKQMTTVTTGERSGLTVQQLIQKVVDVRPDQPASALDLELLKAQVNKDQKNFKAKLSRIEAGINKVFDPDGDGIPGVAPKAKAKNGMPDLPGMPSMPALEDRSSDNNKNAKPGSNNASNKVVIKLSESPTALLFQALKERSPSAKKESNARIHR